ncbi:hypothetical protein BDZ89DRAFT_1160139 [Hymenopellis radicata]|nr:hypothetical protein BDZ89DRAFT_1160139 [Hymenopellis radicata]
MSTCLPFELFGLIIDAVYENGDMRTLRVLSTTSQSLSPHSQTRLFWHLCADCPERVQRLSDMTVLFPRLARLARMLTIRDYHPTELIEDDFAQGLVYEESWAIRQWESSLPDLMKSLPNLRAICLDGEPENYFHYPLVLPHIQHAFRLSEITSVQLRNTESETCHGFFALFQGSFIKHFHVDDTSIFVPTPHDRAACRLKTTSLPPTPVSHRLRLSTLSIGSSGCLLDYLGSPACVVDISRLTCLSLSFSDMLDLGQSCRSRISALLSPELREFEINEILTLQDDVLDPYNFAPCTALRRFKMSVELKRGRLHRFIDVWGHIARTIASLPPGLALEDLEINVKLDWHDVRSSLRYLKNPDSVDATSNDEDLARLVNWDRLDEVLSVMNLHHLRSEVRVRFSIFKLPDGDWAPLGQEEKKLIKKGFRRYLNAGFWKTILLSVDIARQSRPIYL